MAKSTKRRFLFIINFLICFTLLCFIIACGSGGGGRSSDEEELAGEYTLDLTTFDTGLQAGETSVITAEVRDANGTPVSGQAVEFTVLHNNSGGTLAIQGTGTTDAYGQAQAIFTTGSNNPSSDLEDVIQASIPGSTKSIIITRFGLTYYLDVTLVPDNVDSLQAGETVTIKAKVTSSYATNAVSGYAVDFSVFRNNSGGTLTIQGTGTTDANGEALATYTIGSNTPATEVADIITASIPGDSETITLTRGTSPSAVSQGSLSLNISSSVVTFGSPVTVTATLRNTDGALVPNAVVSFSAASSLVTFTPVSATALTNASGVASITLNAASVDSSGATYITASAPVTSGTTTATITSTPVGIAVNGAAITLGAITLGQSSISSYGTSSITVPVLINGSPATAPISVNFTSACVASGKAAISSPVTSNAVTGIASSTYKDNNCNSGTDLITASVVGGATASATITVMPPVASNIKFISATPEIIGTSTASSPLLSKSSVVKFQVVDNNNYGKSGVGVTFSLLPTNSSLGITFAPTTAISDADGYVTTSVTSGTVPTPIWVVATITSTPAIHSQSNTLTITTGLPTQNFFSLSVSTHNIEGWVYDNVTSEVTVIASDRLGNPVPDGTVVNFITEGGNISNKNTSSASCTTANGTCSVTFTSSQYKPINETTTVNPNGAVAALEYDGVTPITIDGGSPLFVKNGRVTILAYALGEKSFLDANGNNMYDSEIFYDLGDLYIDANENGIWDSNATQPNLLEQHISYVSGTQSCTTRPGGAPLPANYWSSPSKENTCNATWGINYVRRSNLIILSESSPLISQHSFNMAGSCSRTFAFWLMDENYNPMPAGTKVTTSGNAIWGRYIDTGGNPSSSLATSTIDGQPVCDSTHAGGTLVSLTIDGGASCQNAASVISYPAGTLNIVTETPLGLITSIPVVIY